MPLDRRRPRTLSSQPLVLIVDGHDDTRELYEASLGSFGFETVTVADGTHAFACASETHPDIIVTEVSLPRLDGWGLVEALKRDSRTRDIPVVVLTAHAQATMRERAGREGCVAVLVKPYLPEQLAQALRELLGPSSAPEHPAGRR